MRVWRLALGLILLSSPFIFANDSLWITIQQAGNAPTDLERIDILKSLREQPSLERQFISDLDKMISEIDKYIHEQHPYYFAEQVLKSGAYNFGISKDSPLQPLALLYQAQMQARLVQERGALWSSPDARRKKLDEVEAMFENLRRYFPQNEVVRVYLGEPVERRDQVLTALCVVGVALSASNVSLSDIHMRDPFVLPVPEEGAYYLFGSFGQFDRDKGAPVYKSTDLIHWSGPEIALAPSDDFPSENYWAPEVHKYRGKYYMLITLKPAGKARGTYVLVSDKPTGPYAMTSRQAVTPADWYCLDGTLYVDESGKPWMVFCHEWVQVGDGEICAMPLKDDLTAAAGEPVLLFKASAAPWITPERAQVAVADAAEHGPNTDVERHGLVTDGPFLYKTSAGPLAMLWSTFGKGGYQTLVARSESGKLTGPWVQNARPLISADCGHAMLFKRLDGQLTISLHEPNTRPNERPWLFEVEDKDGDIRFKLGHWVS